MPKIYAVISGSIVAVLSVLGQTGVLPHALTDALSTLVALVVTQLAHNAPSAKPAAKG